MFNRIRKLLADDGDPLGGEVELDETFIGGKIKNRHKAVDPRRGTNPGRIPPNDPWVTPVFGMVERGGRLIARVVPNTTSATLLPHVRQHVLPSSMIFTDEWAAYHHLGKEGFYHRRVNHSQKIYVDGPVHTNTIEGFWSLVKRGIDGVYHSVSRKWLQDYLNEYAFRYNHRDVQRPMFRLLLENVQVDREAYVPAFPPKRPRPGLAA
jgi:transposase-like protein